MVVVRRATVPFFREFGLELHELRLRALGGLLGLGRVGRSIRCREGLVGVPWNAILQPRARVKTCQASMPINPRSKTKARMTPRATPEAG